jgi:hypothetical protein
MKKILINIFFLGLFVTAYSQNADDEKAIKQLLEKESATWRSGDIKGHADCWHIQPYSRIVFSTVDGTMYDVNPEMMINPPPDRVGKGGSAENSNYKMGIHSDNAWVSHNEESTAADGKKTYTLEIRILEKINGEWKIVGESIHAYKPK